MKQVMVVALVALAGCKTSNDVTASPQKTAEPVPAQTADPAPARPPAAQPTSAAAEPVKPAGTTTAEPSADPPGDPRPVAFAPFTEALAGTRAWLDDRGKHGVVELEAIDDASGRSKGTFRVRRRCGTDAVAAVGAIGKRIAARANAGTHDAPACYAGGDLVACAQAGHGEGDVGLEVAYRKSGDGWQVVGVKTYAMGVTMDTQEAQFEKLIAGACR